MQRAFIELLRYVASRRKAENIRQSAVNTVLVVELTRLGDVLAMMPSLARLQEVFPDASIHVLVDQQYTSLLGSLKTCLRFIGVVNPQSALGLVQAIGSVRGMSVDLAISMSSPRRNVLVTLASNARFKLGYLTFVDSLTPFLLSTHVEAFGFKLPTSATYSYENIYKRSEKICAALGADVRQSQLGIEVKPDVFQAVRERLATQGFIPQNKYVLLHPFSGWEYRNWNLAGYVSLAKKIVDEIGYDVVISCEKKDVERVRQELPSASTTRVVASSDLLDVAILMKGATLVVCSDSGPLHLAAALNVKTVGLFGPAPPELTAPLHNHGMFLYRNVECSPCDQRACVRSERPCMMLLQLGEVFDAVARILDAPFVEEKVSENG